MYFQRKNSSYNLQQSYNSNYSIADQSIHSFGRQKKRFASQVHDINNSLQNLEFIVNEDQQSKLNSLNWSSNSTGEFGMNNFPLLCCRTFFTQNQTIPEPESINFQFKAYSFPFCKSKNETLKKTMCAFLNCNGGHIFIGIEQNINTKQHKVRGGYYTQAQKQQLLKVMRKNAEFIEPEIIINKKMQINFIPVKYNYYPYPYIAGRFVVKIKISPGIRDQIYTVKTQENEYFLCMRTENEVITYDIRKDIRKFLAIQKQRAKFPLQQPSNLHKYECKKPEQGARIFQHLNKSLKRSNKNSNNSMQSYSMEKNESNQQDKKPQKYLKIKKNQSYSSQKTRSQKSKNSSQKHSIQKDIKSQRSKRSRRRSRRNKSKKQNSKNETNNSRQKFIEINSNIEKANKFQNKNSMNNSNLQQKQKKIDLIRNCERIVQRFYDTKGSKIIKNNEKTQSSNQQSLSLPKKSQKKLKVVQTKISGIKQKNVQILFKNNPQQAKDQKNQKQEDLKLKSKLKPKLNQKRLQTKIFYLLRNMKNVQQNSLSAHLKQFVGDLLSITNNNHRIFGFSGFSRIQVQEILSQFTNIEQYASIQFQDLMVYKFNKETDESLLKLALTKAIQNQNLNFSHSSYYKQGIQTNISYKNTDAKKQKIKKTNEQKSCSQTNPQNLKKKKLRIVFKLTARIKIIKYNSLTLSQKTKLKEIAVLIQELTQKKNIYQNLFTEQKNLQTPKIKEIVLPNLYYSLLVYLELNKENINIIFC